MYNYKYQKQLYPQTIQLFIGLQNIMRATSIPILLYVDDVQHIIIQAEVTRIRPQQDQATSFYYAYIYICVCIYIHIYVHYYIPYKLNKK